VARIGDISAQGIALVLRRRFEPGAILFIEPLAVAGQTPVFLLAQVVRAAAAEDGEWLHGCRFANELGEDEVRTLC
jgi:hypothetical protein